MKKRKLEIPNLLECFVLGLIPILFYLCTCAPSIGLGDTALLIDNIQNLKINSHVNNHNFTIVIGWLFSLLPVGNIAFRANLVSVFLGSAAIILFYYLMLKLLHSRIKALLCGLFLMISHSMWWHSTISEVYAANAIFVILALRLLVQLREKEDEKSLYALFFIAGFAVFNHVQLGIIAFGAAAYLAMSMIQNPKTALRQFWGSSICFLAGFTPYLIVFLKDVHGVGSFEPVFSWALGGDFKGIMFKGAWGTSLMDFVYLVFNQFPNFFLFCILFGVPIFMKQWKHIKSLVAVWVMLLMNTIFFMFYQTWDKFAFLLPSFVVLAFIGGFGLSVFHDWVIKRNTVWKGAAVSAVLASLLFPPYLYAHQSVWGADPQSFWFGRYNNLYTENTHNVSVYITNPNKRHYRDIDELAALIFEKLPQGAILFDDDSRSYYPLAEYFQRYYHKRPDLEIRLVNSWGFKNWGDDESYFADRLRSAYRLDAPLFLISNKHPFSRMVRQIPGSNKYQFEVFRLDENRWIYRLKTASETGDLAAFVPDKWHEHDSRKPILIDLKKEHVLYARNGNISEQDMSSFGNEWLNDDQIFFHINGKGAELAFLMRFSEAFNGKMRLWMTEGNDFGMIQVELNGQNISGVLDFFADQVGLREAVLSHVVFEKGNNILVIKNAGKNIQSKGFFSGIDRVQLERA